MLHEARAGPHDGDAGDSDGANDDALLVIHNELLDEFELLLHGFSFVGRSFIIALVFYARKKKRMNVVEGGAF